MSTRNWSQDRLGRPLGVLRLSLTARCNLACTYCRPAGDEPSNRLNRPAQMAVIRAASRLGLQSLRLTGGEPLLSPQLEPLLQAITRGRTDPSDPLAGLQEVALTSNGVLLSRERAAALRQAGLDRITLSLDAANREGFVRMAGMPSASAHLFERVLSGLHAALDAGFDPSKGELKINSVIQRHHNEDQLIPLARLARRHGIELRLIEFMDVGHRNHWHQDQVITASEMLEVLREHWPMQPLGRAIGSTASRWRFSDGRGLVATIASISEPFCGDCNRLRVTADGIAFPCLFATQGVDLRPWLQPGVDEDGLTNAIRELWMARENRYSEERGRFNQEQRRQEMAYLGG
ncbi:hypothetical protein KR100_00540 [Synechococcus sp. KORDI-100]|uniref:GTP 3',8-cyclase MoaA n=1 Tax=Synechococcus sp. KORDI-100 TaxID=1280380 RepID=UPI0004E099F1|nr:radical SAM protein [Synechococcus sp. KORDI-100]AII41895.1 hypothetical protein KR100_00540 [Synechococcus sp. KORDI-100]